MLCLSVIGPSFSQIKDQITFLRNYFLKNKNLKKKWLNKRGCLEFRFDLFDSTILSYTRFFQEIKRIIDFPVIFTLRSKEEGGGFLGSSLERELVIRELLSFSPDYIDLEERRDQAIIEKVKKTNTKIILSYHGKNLRKGSLESIYLRMKAFSPDYYKIALSINSSLEVLSFFLFSRENFLTTSTFIALGEKGKSSRLLGRIFGSCFIYTCMDVSTSSGLGQEPIASLDSCYRVGQQHKNTKIYALIGDPIDKSRGHLKHNAFFSKKRVDAVYVKFEVKIQEVPEFLNKAKILGFKGLSVTMPLKEEIINYLDKVDESAKNIEAINTVALEDGKWVGYNTDGKGALKAVEEKIAVKKGEFWQGKRCCIIGAGGTAKAIICALLENNAEVLIFNRTEEKAEELGKLFCCKGYALSELASILKDGVDVVFHCTSVGMTPNIEESLIPEFLLQKGMIVLDAVYHPEETKLLKQAKEKGCITVSGLDMFHAQANEQQRIWF